MRRDETVPSLAAWEPTADLLDVLLTGLTPKLKEVLALRGVRFYEMEILDRHAFEIPHRCLLLLDLHETASEALDGIKKAVGGSQPEKEQGVRDLILCHAAFSRRIASQLARDRHRPARPRGLHPPVGRGGREAPRPAAAPEPRRGRALPRGRVISLLPAVLQAVMPNRRPLLFAAALALLTLAAF